MLYFKLPHFAAGATAVLVATACLDVLTPIVSHANEPITNCERLEEFQPPYPGLIGPRDWPLPNQQPLPPDWEELLRRKLPPFFPNPKPGWKPWRYPFPYPDPISPRLVPAALES